MRLDRKLCGFMITTITFVLVITIFDTLGPSFRSNLNIDYQTEFRLVQVEGQIYRFPDDIRLRNLTLEPYSVQLPSPDIRKEYIRLLGHLELECRHSARLGSFTDGGWHVCIAPPYSLKSPCLVYDFGIARKWSFDDAITREYDCKLRAFDPTSGLREHNRTSHIHFYPVGLWGSDGTHDKGFPVKTFKSLLQEFGEENSTIDVLKLDIEGSEWAALRTMLEDGSLARVKQLAVEVHALSPVPAEAVNEYVSVLKGLRAAGFRLWRDDWNTKNIMYLKHLGYQTACHEQYFLNINFQK